jgi:hypothetical protein
MNDFSTVIFGQLSIGTFFGYVALMLIGTIINSAFDASTRDKQSSKTPVKWSWKFFIADNIKRYVGTALMLYVCIRFSDKIFGSEPIDWMMVVLGYNIDSIFVFVKNKTSILSADREKLLSKVSQ